MPNGLLLAWPTMGIAFGVSWNTILLLFKQALRLKSWSVGPNFSIHSLLAIIAYKGRYLQALHQDSGNIQTETPILANHLVFLDDVNYWNGGTLIVPRNHKIACESGYHQLVGELSPAISVEAKVGTIMLMDGHTLHGTGVNKTDKPRHILVMSCIKPWIRTQELHVISLRPKVLATTSRKLLQRLGFIGEPVG